MTTNTTETLDNGQVKDSTVKTYSPTQEYGKPRPVRSFVGMNTDADMDEAKDHGMRAGLTTIVVSAAAGTPVGIPVAVGLVAYQVARGVQTHRRYDKIRKAIAAQADTTVI